MLCICRKCRKKYNDQTSRSDWTGYCSQKCMKTMAKELGCKRDGQEYAILKQANAIGAIRVGGT